ncbi:hypothetical protein FHG87_007225 [Trinorchestia longiramus]|nr:hypothetical protein FHG87_007225 [Trinorchestia longiramus]
MLRSNSLKKLAVIQNTALRNILGVRKTSPVLSLEVESRIPPLELRFQLLTARWYILLKNRGNHDYTLKQLGLARRGQQTVFETQARQVLVSMKALIPHRVQTGTLSPVPPWSNFPNFISVNAPCRTAYHGQEAANEAIMQEDLNAQYSGFTQIFTDGSKLSSGSTAAVLFVPSLAQAVEVGISKPASTVFPFIAPSHHCYCCERLGHVTVNCNSPLRCLVCSGPHTKNECTAELEQEKCANCHQTHIVSSKDYPAIRNVTAIQKLQGSGVGFEAAKHKVMKTQ